jgi:hypothetical protein
MLSGADGMLLAAGVAFAIVGLGIMALPALTWPLPIAPHQGPSYFFADLWKRGRADHVPPVFTLLLFLFAIGLAEVASDCWSNSPSTGDQRVLTSQGRLGKSSLPKIRASSRACSTAIVSTTRREPMQVFVN